ncbi:hypothetical protein PR048_007319 [Dryococelus australis]|uniref:Uncharacterized protein n=1 Tax=Dryococelus australis TaxID=614101 RepID=A0ABQ9IEK6_9NEOP|nr:hypothetical protein PR048_007319 [Dryococelus australis]
MNGLQAILSFHQATWCSGKPSYSHSGDSAFDPLPSNPKCLLGKLEVSAGKLEVSAGKARSICWEGSKYLLRMLEVSVGKARNSCSGIRSTSWRNPRGDTDRRIEIKGGGPGRPRRAAVIDCHAVTAGGRFANYVVGGEMANVRVEHAMLAFPSAPISNPLLLLANPLKSHSDAIELASARFDLQRGVTLSNSLTGHRGRGGVVVRLLASRLGKSGSIPGGVALGYSLIGGRRKRETPEKTRRLAASYSTIPACRNPKANPVGNRFRFALVEGELSNHCGIRASIRQSTCL